MIANETLYRDKDGRIVPEGDPSAAFLVCRKGANVPKDVQEFIESQGRKIKPAPPIDPTIAPENRGLSAKRLAKRGE